MQKALTRAPHSRTLIKPSTCALRQVQWVRIPNEAIGELALQAQGEGIIAAGDISLLMRAVHI